MKHIEQEMLELKQEIHSMWQLVLSQVDKAQEALFAGDKELAREVIRREKKVDIYDVKIERDCENFIALYSPVAIDLRMVLSLMRIAHTLERIADFAAGIASSVIDDDFSSLDPSLMEEVQAEPMWKTIRGMLFDTYSAWENENSKLYKKIVDKDEEVNLIYRKAPRVLADYITLHPETAYGMLKLFLIIRKLERMGDHCSNIAEEIVFYIDARVLKHSSEKNLPI